MKKNLFLVGSTAFWLAMMSLLIQKEFFQFTPLQAGYEILPLGNPEGIREEYRAIYFGGERLGFSQSVLEKNAKDSPHPFELRFVTYLSLLFLGQEREMLIRGKAGLDERLFVQDFQFRLSSGDTWSEIKAQTAKGNLNIVFESKGAEPTRTLLPLKRPLFFSDALVFLWTPENLRLGKRGTLQVWNPLIMNFQDIEFHVERREPLKHRNQTLDAFRVNVTVGGVATRMWVSPEGVVLREESPTGLTLINEEAYEIFDAMREKKYRLDLPSLFSIASNKTFENPESLTFLKATLDAPEGVKTLEILRADLDGLETVPLKAPEDPALQPYLEHSPWIQTHDPAIERQAREIAGGETSALQAALKISEWVHAHVKPMPTLSVPSALDVLAARRGDCNEFTALFTALARSLGIPTKMIAGLVYQNGRFFYHAWPEVWLGRWIPLDPTFDQNPADVTHLPLIEGNLEQQTQLVTQIGRLKVEVLETE